MKRCMIYIAYGLCLVTLFSGSLLGSEAMAKNVATEPVQQEVTVLQGKIVEDCTSISMDELVEGLKESKAIGFFTKLAIRSDVLGFRDKVKKIRRNNQLKDKMESIKANFDGLLLKIMALLEKDPDLSKKIYLGRHSIFKSLMEVKT